MQKRLTKWGKKIQKSKICSALTGQQIPDKNCLDMIK